jgi:hypothetical protein
MVAHKIAYLSNFTKNMQSSEHIAWSFSRPGKKAEGEKGPEAQTPLM